MVNVMFKEVVLVEYNGVVDELKVLCIVKDEIIVDWKCSQYIVNLLVFILVKELYFYVVKEVNYVEDIFLLVWNKILGEGNEEVVFNGEKNRIL